MATSQPLGMKIKSLRRQNKWTLAEMSDHTDVPLSSLSKIENGQLSPTYDQLLKLSKGLGLDVAELLSDKTDHDKPNIIGRRSINGVDDGVIVEDHLQTLHYLSSDLLDKAFVPMIADIKARNIDDYKELLRHPGEEFFYVVEGIVDLHSELYAPLRLHPGESIYFDSSMGHGYVAVGDQPARALSICTTSINKLPHPVDPRLKAKPKPKSKIKKPKQPSE